MSPYDVTVSYDLVHHNEKKGEEMLGIFVMTTMIIIMMNIMSWS